MILLILLSIPYDITADRMQIIDKKKNIFKGNVSVKSESLLINSNLGIQTDTVLILKEDVYGERGDFNFTSNWVIYKPATKTLHAGDEIKVWRKDTMMGNSLKYFRDKDFAIIDGNLEYINDSARVKAKRGFLFKDSTKLYGNIIFDSPRISVKSDSMKFSPEDSTYRFFSNVSFKSEQSSGKSNRLIHKQNNAVSILIENAWIFQEKDTVIGSKITLKHNNNELLVSKGKSISHLPGGKNIVYGDSIEVYFHQKNLDSVIVRKKGRGTFSKNETENKESG